MTARALLRLLYWPFPTARAMAYFYAGLFAGFLLGLAALFAAVLLLAGVL